MSRLVSEKLTESATAAVVSMSVESPYLPALQRATAFARSLGDATYDPFDIKSLPFIARTYQSRNPLGRLARALVYGLELVAPVPLRRALGVPKRVTAGGMGRWAQACLALYRLDGDDAHLAEAERALKWLLDHPGTSDTGLGWGVPFEWTTYFGTVPPDTAVAHTTHACGAAFLDFHEATGAPWAFEAALKCCQFLTEGLNIKTHPSGSASLSYTPIDDTEVVNISSESAAFLLRCARPADQPLVWRLGAFVTEAQNPDGSWLYAAPGSTDAANPIDHYHTAMVLHGLIGLSSNIDVRGAFERGLAFHIQYHFLPDGCPKLRPDAVHPIDIYSAGESLLLLLSAACLEWLDAELRSECRATVRRLARYTIDNMAFPDGGFVYRRYSHRAMRVDSMRWAQALMVHALAELCLCDGLESS